MTAVDAKLCDRVATEAANDIIAKLSAANAPALTVLLTLEMLTVCLLIKMGII